MQLSKPDLLTLMNDKLPDNTEQDITPQDLRDVLESMIESDSNPNDIGTENFTTTDLDALTNAVTAILLLSSFPAHAEFSRGTVGANNLPLAGGVLSFDQEGAVLTLQYVGTEGIEVFVNNPLKPFFNVQFEGSVDMDTNTAFTVWLRVNNVNVRQLGTLMAANNTIVSFSFGAFFEFTDNDIAEIFVVPNADAKDFDLQIGSRFRITHI